LVDIQEVSSSSLLLPTSIDALNIKAKAVKLTAFII
jgi:hypothetical protein